MRFRSLLRATSLAGLGSARRLNSPSFSMRLLAACAAGSALAIPSEASAQALGGQFPFPSSNVAAGVTTDALTTHELRRLYLDWRDALIERCPQGDARMRYPETNNDTRSEGIGYGMVIAAYMGDQVTFDGLWDYYQRTSTNGLMNWRRDDCSGNGGGGDNGSAADADIDAALAVIVADRQFPGNGYAQEAQRILGDIRGQLFQGGCQGVLLAGSQFGGCDCINPSYIPPAYYVAYAELEEPGFWEQARSASYDYFNAARNAQTGLVPAWSQVNGSLQIGCGPQVSGGGATFEYQADAARTPWRVATDYQWTGDERAADFLSSIGGFALDQNLMRIRDRYTLEGQRANDDELSSHELGRNTYVIGGFATAMVAASQQDIDDFTGAWMSVYKDGDNFGGTFRAFNNSLALLYGLVLTGTMWNPVGAEPAPLPEPALSEPVPGDLVVNGDFEEGVFGWEGRSDYYDYGNTQTFTGSDGFAMHRAGEMHLRVLRNEPNQPQRMSLRQRVSLQQGQRYLLSVDARGLGTRSLRVAVQGEDGAYGGIATNADGTFTVDSQMRTFQGVFEASASDPEATLIFQFGHSTEDVIIDNVRLEPTQLPLDPGSAVGGNAPRPGGGGSGSGNGNGSDDLGTIDGNSDSFDGSDSADGAGSGGSTGGGAQQPTGPGSLSAEACAPASYSPALDLCFEATTGYVGTSSQGPWQLPPPLESCGVDEADPNSFYHWWPLIQACYSPVSGYAWSEREGQWIFVGVDFVQGQTADEGACAVSPGRQRGTGSGALLALLGLGVAVGRRRRR